MADTTVTVDLQNLMAEKGDSIKRVVEEALLQNLKSTLSWTAEYQIKEAVETFAKETLAPEIGKYLNEKKTEIIAQVRLAIDGAFAQVGEKLTQKAAENLTKSWNVEKVWDAMFK